MAARWKLNVITPIRVTFTLTWNFTGARPQHRRCSQSARRRKSDIASDQVFCGDRWNRTIGLSIISARHRYWCERLGTDWYSPRRGGTAAKGPDRPGTRYGRAMDARQGHHAERCPLVHGHLGMAHYGNAPAGDDGGRGTCWRALTDAPAPRTRRPISVQVRTSAAGRKGDDGSRTVDIGSASEAGQLEVEQRVSVEAHACEGPGDL